MSLRLDSREDLGVSSLGDSVWKWELDLRVVEHLDSGSLGLRSVDWLDLEDVDTVSLGTMTGSHVTVALGDGSSDGVVTVLSVHVVVSGTGIVLEPDSVVLDGSGVLLELLLDREDLSVGLLHTTKHGDEVPETGLGDDMVGGEDLHLPDWSHWLLLRWDLASDNGVFVENRLQTSSHDRRRRQKTKRREEAKRVRYEKVLH